MKKLEIKENLEIFLNTAQDEQDKKFKCKG